MHVLITGANGFVGQALTKHILSQGCVGDRRVSRLTLLDRQFDGGLVDQSTDGLVVEHQGGDLADDQWLKDTLGRFPMDVIFHLASIPGGMAEQNDELGRRVNIDATMTLLEICKAQTELTGRKPVFVFASSIAVFGIMPDWVSDNTPLKPQMSYGAHKVVGEVMVNDFSRRGWIDGRSLRLPGVLARPPAETGQLSAFLSDIIREVSQGHAFVCPMSAESKTWASSLPNIIENLLHGAAVEESKLKSNRTFTLPTLCFSMAQMVDAIGLVYQQNANELVSYEPNPMIEKLFGCFPLLETLAADKVGFRHDVDLNNLVRRALFKGH
ncbi:NAD-dependent epimerase/dehydratase family protein [Marinomonas sp. M1K-6]|uniref:NAD-dependent epimerase/dehydratase family protein n=1 Tax=Marinomonas profundi TaxID=2726122 RepID=A0A847R722_9GAMM|nr:NAD-dependent epimerase/dehydratase family protein [Marinomonas profundi]NLQ18283.1 NAD-dependent epimerase/dehydratase family protein [Marinomonas profundi]UDV02346.1 NAD-dependent epimerase/dehydratase family protein [Marinomonas profundi]